MRNRQTDPKSPLDLPRDEAAFSLHFRPMDDLFEVKTVEGKGQGLFATCALNPGQSKSVLR